MNKVNICLIKIPFCVDKCTTNTVSKCLIIEDRDDDYDWKEELTQLVGKKICLITRLLFLLIGGQHLNSVEPAGISSAASIR